MSAGGTYQNESLSSYHIFQPLTTSSALRHQDYQDTNYCVLPTLHRHSIDRKLDGRWSLVDDELDETLELLRSQSELQSDANFYLDTKENNSSQIVNQSEGALESGRLSSAESGTNSKIGNQLDPYIDAVQVKRRVNNKRGERVKAANGRGQQQAKMVQVKGADRVPDSSYYSKSVHIEESNGASKEWDYSSGDSDSDDDDHHHHHHHHKGHKKKKRRGKKKGKKKYVKKHKPKKVYVAEVHYAKPVKYHHGHSKHYDHDDYDHKHKHHKHYGPKHEKKIVYVKYEKPGGKYHEHGYHHYEHDKHDDHYDDGHHGHKKHHDDHYHDKDHHHHHHNHGKSKGGKLVHLNVMGKGKMSLAGILGQTLLCINYLLVLKQPTYDKYSSHYHTTYSPHGGHGDTVEVRSKGPIILAHCGELPEAHSLVPSIGIAKSATELARSHLVTLPSKFATNSSDTTDHREHRAANNQSSELANGTIPVNISISQTGALNMKKDLRLNLTTAEQQAEVYYLNQGPRRTAPDSYARYHSLANYQADQPMLSRDSGTSLLTPIQSYLNRLLFNSPQNEPETRTTNEIETDSLQVVNMPRQRIRVQNDPGDGRNSIQLLRQTELADDRETSRLVAPNRRVVIVPGGQAQLIQARDNLVDLRTRRVPIVMRVTDGLRFGLNQRALSLTQQQQAQVGSPELGLSPPGLAVRVPDQLMQNDQPQTDNENERSTRTSDVPNGVTAQQLLLDAPEYAIAGDSIELTCNHRILPDRLYSVRWFKDSMEFYRFVPNNAPVKSSLMLPDVIVDVQRSNSQSLYVRNVTHRSSGLYRCEVISEAPNFELVTGERQIQVYSLPGTGPRLNLLDRDEPVTTTTATMIASNGRLQTINSVALNGGVVRTGTQLLGTRSTMSSAEREIEDDNEADQRNWAPVPGNGLRLQAGAQQQRQRGTGPIVRCLSDRSNPVAQLRFLVNNRPVPSGRTIENSTLSYSDGLESNVISFQIQLADFVLDANDQSSLDKAASLKSAAGGTNGNGTQTAQATAISTTSTTTTSTTTTTTTTTSTTRRPKLKVSRGKEKKMKLEKKKKQNVESANSAVQFDDHAGDILSSSKGNEPKKRKKDENRSRPKSSRVHESGDKMIKYDETEDEDAEGSMQTTGHSDRNPQLGPLPVEKRQTELVGTVTGDQHLIAKRNVTESNGQATNSKSSRATPSPGTGDNLNEAEQRNSVTNRVRSRISNSDQQRQQLVYSNFIRIKCVSTVPTLGYEMISELNVPLTLIVPASRLSDALRQPTNNGGPQSLLENGRVNDNDPRLEERQSDGDTENDVGGNQSNDRRQQQQGRKPVGNIGSLQRPRAVVIDRVAQASGRRSSSVVYHSQERSAEQNKIDRNQDDVSYRGGILTRRTPVRTSSGAETNLASSTAALVAMISVIVLSTYWPEFQVANVAVF